MATVPTTSHGVYPQAPLRTYMSIRAFNNNFFSYTVTKGGPPSFTVTGTLGTVTGANSYNCPAGRTLRENGKRLFPSANPGVSTYMVGVYDADSLLSGFIDPNDSVFTVYNTNKPVYLPDGVSPVTSLTDKAPGVYSLGDIVTTAGNVIAGGQIRSSTVTALTPVTATATRNIDASLGVVHTVNLQFTAATQTLTVTASNVTDGCLVVLRVFANASHTTAGTLALGTNIFATDATIASTASRYYTITFIGVGTELFEIGRAGSAVGTGGLA